MDAEHLLPPLHPLDALVAAAQLDELSLRHLRSCSTCRAAWYKVGAFPAGCTDPRLGALMLHALGSRPIEPRVHAHMETCLSCRLRLLQASRAMDASV
jgi:predicted anti-sigma-YlaC factor YlaD